MTKGVQSHPGCGTTIKHYACNNQEDNRKGSDSILTEKTLRELYLRSFGIAIREAHPNVPDDQLQSHQRGPCGQ